ncbi:MAG: IS110 family transposase [Thermoplasmata archaeon]
MYKRKKNIDKKRIDNMNSYVAGIDLGEKESYVTYMAPDGDIKEQFKFSMDKKGYDEFAVKIPLNTKIAFEASGSAYAVSKALKNIGYTDITVAHPKELSWIIKSKKKNDKVDSLKLAKLHLVGMIPESHLLNDEDRILRDMLVQRVKLGRSISSIKNSIIGYLKREGLFDSLPVSSDNFSNMRRKAMKEIRFGNEKDLIFTNMIAQLEFYEKQCIPLDKGIKRIAKESEDVKILLSIPGIDYYLASLLSSYIGDVHRFDNNDKLAAFFGIIPSIKESSTIKRSGHMSKDGAGTARWALSLAVDTIIMWNEPMKEYYDSIKKKKGSG